MNNELYGNPYTNVPIYPNATALTKPQAGANFANTMPITNQLPMEQSYIENILRLNKGKKVRVHMTFPDSIEWRDREFSGIIEESGRDHIILSEPSTGKWQLLLMLYVDYISFDEPINYSQQFIPTT
ncbi:MAG TPA: spore coat protein GerQ [Tenericutes bacterium]|nr:spore coat protein GerQ [Mycoplasmatota bacterium]